jgi:hypothetical protein
MAITQTISNLPPAPQSTDPSNFRPKADTFVAALNTFEDELNLAIPQMNALETNVNNKEASATSSALVCTSAANFQGTWTNQTTVVGQSWAYNGLVYIVLVAGNTSPTASPSNWMSLGIDTQIHSAPSKTTPVDADEVPIVDSATSFSLKKLTWGNLKATLKAYFDGIYANLSSPALTGTPTAPTAAAGTNTTQIATTAYVDGKMILRTSVATTSGTSIDFTGIPSWVKRITVMFNGVSTNAASSSRVQIQLGNGSVVTSGYSSIAGTIGSTSSTTSSSGLVNSGIVIDGYAPTTAWLRTGYVTLYNIAGNTWLCSGVTSDVSASTSTQMYGGSVSLTSAIDRIRLTTVNGTDTFDGGSINIMYEG